ncbi:hypothetical protein [Mesorhizobium sp. M7A.F.Ca.MR.362.00.0.0]|uniref:hypothetical protein n=1 Tax=Mesorhizobium sp. M7A.F.Ca.MR.362.00.0.0 TaxID=2496779 RepID=UPI000FD26A08|nr:hypothetical protein [Mesorhizobium sp. M7A.F.Ca.MR.362.00.0.0]RUU76139.1 hypothetical protein EOC06_28185 [Mesorhizobium sp. M7A.F.Ca.MR.362.00.0.0]RWN95401.1 MAG: hypothetical protein EOS05_11450 [Mesorhizobium sp.]
MKLHAVWSKKYAHWVLLNNDCVERGETRVVARLYDCDGPAIAERFNTHRNPDRYLTLMKEVHGL